MGNEVYSIIKEIATLLIAGIISVITSKIVVRYEFNKRKHEEKFKEFYNKFYVLRDLIHHGRAYNFTDLSQEEQDSIVKFFIETNCYQNKEISDLVYELETAKLNNFDNFNKSNIDKCNNVYDILSEKIIDKYMKHKPN